MTIKKKKRKKGMRTKGRDDDKQLGRANFFFWENKSKLLH